jgi:hypothetical protein
MEAPLYPNEAAALAAEGEIYKHFKGGVYRLIQRDIKNSETLQSGVLYEHLWPHNHGFWWRPADVFFSTLPDGSPRFRRVK